MSTVIKDLGAVSAYAYAVEKGYTGTEAEFAELMADYAEVGQRAEDAAESALNSKTAAQTAATTATNKASEATTAAQTATTKASEATASAQTASTKASEASQSASQASGYAQTAETAKTDAQTAKTQAETARDNAVTAKTAAETARGKAEDAQATAEDAAESVSASAAQIATNTADITGLKSEITALESDGVAPSAEQLLSKNTAADAVPYLFRQTGGDGADREYLDAIVGGTVVWNQLVQDGNFPSDTNWMTLNVSISVSENVCAFLASAQGGYVRGKNVKMVNGHKYFRTATLNANNATSITFNVGGVLPISVASSASYQTLTDVMNWSYSMGNQAVRITDNRSSGWTNVLIKDVMLIDITAMFGTTIADYIYSLEQATAGAGVAFFKSLFPNDYYEYNAGELVSVSGLSEHKMVGFNQWDEVTELGVINHTTGEDTAKTTALRSKNYTDIVGGSVYCFRQGANSIDFHVHWYDANKNFISYKEVYTDSNINYKTATAPNNARYMRFNLPNGYGTTYNHDICINISDPAKNGTYEPYKAHSYPLDSTLTLRGIPKLSDGKIYYDGDRYLPDGKVKRRYGIRTYQSGDESLADAITDGTNTVYKLTTMTIEESTPYRQLQICDPNGTEEFVSTGIIPVGHETRYPDNLRAKIEGLPWDFSSLIAPTEKTTTASRNYTTGSLLIIGNVLYKVTANIANGGTITPNTNVTATTLSEILSALAQ